MTDAMTLKNLQQLVAEWEQATGFSAESAERKCLLLGEEVGELFKAVRLAIGMRVDAASTISPVDEELADLMILVSAIANRFNIDLATALHSKIQKNNARLWR